MIKVMIKAGSGPGTGTPRQIGNSNPTRGNRQYDKQYNRQYNTKIQTTHLKNLFKNKLDMGPRAPAALDQGSQGPTTTKH